jgi:SAM-dependent methyltransferase
MTEEQYLKITKDAAKTWDKFYKNHKCNFFKDRKYLEKEIPELALLRERFEQTKEMSVFVELGCGVGNTLFPIHNQFEYLRLYGCDFANSAIKLINE